MGSVYSILLFFFLVVAHFQFSMPRMHIACNANRAPTSVVVIIIIVIDVEAIIRNDQFKRWIVFVYCVRIRIFLTKLRPATFPAFNLFASVFFLLAINFFLVFGKPVRLVYPFDCRKLNCQTSVACAYSTQWNYLQMPETAARAVCGEVEKKREIYVLFIYHLKSYEKLMISSHAQRHPTDRPTHEIE